MALLDYKIVNFSHTGRHVTATVRVYRGAVTTEQEEVMGVVQDVTRYRRIARVLERVYTYDVPSEWSREQFLVKARAYLNKKLADYATANGHTVITEQTDIADLEVVDNETVI
jgi:hypothetical protein